MWIRIPEGENKIGLTQAEVERLGEIYPLLGSEWYKGCEARRVKIQSFELLRDPVTNEEFSTFLNEVGNRREGKVWWYWEGSPYGLIGKDSDRYSPKPGANNYPVTGVSLYGAHAYAKWLNARLPTEAEWEYAARAGTTTLWPSGDEGPGDNCNHWDITEADYLSSMIVLNDGRGPTPVDAFPHNPWGCRDMIGNVWEWCESPEEEELGFGILRGGSWNDILPIVFLPGFRHRCPLNYRMTYTFGLRLARTI